MRHLMSPLDFSVDELEKLFDLANDIEKNREKYSHACNGKKHVGVRHFRQAVYRHR